MLLYAHHDVQPETTTPMGSPPWEPTERDGRLDGGGAADDKAGIITHLAALRAFGDELPVTVRLFIEGEEEVASAMFPQLLKKYEEELRSDVIVIAHSGNWDIGVPALTTSLRGLIRRFIAEPPHADRNASSTRHAWAASSPTRSWRSSVCSTASGR